MIFNDLHIINYFAAKTAPCLYLNKNMRNERPWKATTGLSQSNFITLCTALKKAGELLHEINPE
jgi:hypothetical protein